MINLKDSFVERYARQRAEAILDKGSFRELLGPFEGIYSPHLLVQNIVPQSDDGVVIARGTIDGFPAVVIAIEGNFQGGSIGEVSGAKIAGALELALEDNRKGIKIRPVIIFDTGGIRLQEANYGLLAISEISSAISELREYVPVVGIIPGKVGSFGGMSINAGLLSSIIITMEGRLGLNGPEVIELEAGIEEIDSQNRQQIWKIIGGEQRLAMGLADHLVDDDVESIKTCLHQIFKEGNTSPRSIQVERFESFISNINPATKLTPQDAQALWKEQHDVKTTAKRKQPVQYNSRGARWFKALTNGTEIIGDDVPSVLCADKGKFRYLSITPNPNSRFYRARQGEVGLEEGWRLAKHIREAIEEDKNGEKRTIVAIVDVPGQAYGYHEELFGIHQACAAAVDAYASARRAGHPIIALMVGNAVSGAFLAHGLQANRIIALDHEEVNVHVMSKKSAAKITRRSIDKLEELACKLVPAMAQDIHSFASLGAVDELVKAVNADEPTMEDVRVIQEKIEELIADIKAGTPGLQHRLQTKGAKENRTASILVRKKLAEQWN
jgi:malonate decarboxylase beta subunit